VWHPPERKNSDNFGGGTFVSGKIIFISSFFTISNIADQGKPSIIQLVYLLQFWRLQVNF